MNQRHTFFISPPENIVNVDLLPYAIFKTSRQNWIAFGQTFRDMEAKYHRSQKPNVFMDVVISDDGSVRLTDWGCIIDGETIQPVWVTQAILDKELETIKNDIK